MRHRLHAAPCGVVQRWRLIAGCGLLGTSGLMAGCGSIQVRPLATGVVEQSAYQLSGSSLSSLRSEAQRLCPQGGEVLRQAQRVEGGHEGGQGERWYGRWWQQTRNTLAPASQEAQLLVLCQPVPGSSVLAKAADPVPGAEAAKAAAGAAVSPASATGHPAPVGEGELRDGLAAALSPSAVRSPDGLRAAAEARAGQLVGAKPQAGDSPRAKSVSAAGKPARASSAPVLTY